MPNDAQQSRRRFPCPKCGRLLEQSGEVSIGKITLPTFQCDECLVNQEIMGEKMEMALTFALGPDGKVFDAAAKDGKLRF
jgi:transcription elongation factor Elf1